MAAPKQLSEQGSIPLVLCRLLGPLCPRAAPRQDGQLAFRAVSAVLACRARVSVSELRKFGVLHDAVRGVVCMTESCTVEACCRRRGGNAVLALGLVSRAFGIVYKGSDSLWRLDSWRAAEATLFAWVWMARRVAALSLVVSLGRFVVVSCCFLCPLAAAGRGGALCHLSREGVRLGRA